MMNVSVRVRTVSWMAAGLLVVALTCPTWAAVYEVGPGKTYATLGAVPWTSLVAGDVVNIYPKVGNAPYYEKLSLSHSGTAVSPITIHGVPDGSGNRPILDGTNAIQNSDSVYNNDRGLIITGDGGDSTGQYWVIENLELRNASYGGLFYRGSTAYTYGSNAAGVFLQGGKSAVVRNCWIHDNMNGIQTGGKSQGVTNVLIEACRIENNGQVGSSQQHNFYNGAEPITVQYCYFGGLKSGADGQNFKDRGSGTIFRYNWIQGGPNDQLDLVDGGTVPADAYVYGNIIVKTNETGNGRMCLFGADSGGNRSGTLYFMNNTFITTRSSSWTTVFQVTAGNTVQAYNNVMYCPWGGSNFQICNGGTVFCSYDWISPGYGASGATMTNIIPASGNNPGFVNYTAQDFHLAAGSGCIDAGALTWPGQASTTPVKQYVVERQSENRPVDSHIDIGAYEYVAPNQPPTVNAGADIAVYEGQPVSLHATASDPDNDPLTYSWTQTAGQTATLTTTNAADLSFMAPTLTSSANGLLTFQVTVSDGKGGTANDSVNAQVYMAGDINHDLSVNVGDLQLLVAAWGSGPTYTGPADLNSDGFVNVGDLQLLVANWGR